MLKLFKLRRQRSIRTIINNMQTLNSDICKGYFYTKKFPEYLFIETDDVETFYKYIGRKFFVKLTAVDVALEELRLSRVSTPKSIESFKPGMIVNFIPPGSKNSKKAIIKDIKDAKTVIINLLDTEGFPFPILTPITNITYDTSTQ